MKKHTGKPPIDELFARKLSNASLTPGPDSFARLQARMGQHKSEPRVVFWRNPEVQRYMAAAACLILICLVGWRYWPSGGTTEQKDNQLATNQPVKPTQEEVIKKETTQAKKEQTTGVISEGELRSQTTTNQVAATDNVGKIGKSRNRQANYDASPQNSYRSGQTLSGASALAQEKPTENRSKIDVTYPTFVTPMTPVTADQIADAKPAAKPSPVAERVLVVTIAEPESLLAARQAAKAAVEEKAILAQNERAAKEAKADGLWQKVKRIKEGDVFARQDNTTNDESGLLGRAYNGLKHSLEKDKPSKQ